MFSEHIRNAKEIKLTKRDDGFYSVSFNMDVYDTNGVDIKDVVEINFGKVKINLGNMEVMVENDKYGDLVTINSENHQNSPSKHK